MHFLFLNVSLAGHVEPSLGLVHELVSRGHAVSYVLPDRWEDAVSRAGAQFISCGDGISDTDSMREAYKIAMTPAIRYDAVVYGYLFFLGYYIAAQRQVPAIRLFTPVVPNGALLQAYMNAGGPQALFGKDFFRKKWTKMAAKNAPVQYDDVFEDILRNVPALNFVYTIPQFQPYAEQFMDGRYHYIGPSRWRPAEEPVDLLPGQPVLYISFGTLLEMSKPFIKSCYEAFGDEGCQVVMAAAERRDAPLNFTMRKRIPQLQVLGQASVFITHGGAGSVNEAMLLGVPMLVLPHFVDQPTNAKMVETLGLGRVLNPKQVTAAGLREAAKAVLADGNIAANVARMKETMQRTGSNREAADRILAVWGL